MRSFTATHRQAQGDNHSKWKKIFIITTGTAQLFQIPILVVVKQKNSKTLKAACHPEPGEGLL
jgi:hypothetical protein